MGGLIPGLIDDLARECFIRIPYHGLPKAGTVCKAWNFEISLPEFRHMRKASGLTRPVIVLAQTRCDDPSWNSGEGAKENQARPVNKLAQVEPGTGCWVGLPEIHGQSDGLGLPMFCGLVGVGSDLVVIGGWDPVTLRASGGVYVYSLLSGKWRRGSDMPGVRRSFFGCASDGQTVLIAGGHDEDKNALKSALLYDVAEDKWVELPVMARERDECKVIFHRGRFHVISGYSTQTQGHFGRSTEVFDLATWQWGPVIEDFLEESANSRSCLAGPDGRLYACVGPRGDDVAVQQGDSWQVVAKVPVDVGSSQWVATCGDKLVVIGCLKFGEPNNGYLLDLKDCKWNKIEMPKDYSGHVQSGCVLEL